MQKTPMYRSSRTAKALVVLAIAVPVIMTSARAQDGESYSSLAQKEMVRRQNAVIEADRLLKEGRDAYTAGDFQKALDKYTQALQGVPDAPMFADRRASYSQHVSDAKLALAMKSRNEGNYTEAKELLDTVVAENPENWDAARELDYLNDPLRSNPALTPEHTKNVEEVERALTKADGQFSLGNFNQAKKEYESVLRIDPYNRAARRGMEKVAATKSDYYSAAYDQTRAELLSQVDAAWEITVPDTTPDVGILNPSNTGESTGVAYITEKLRRIVIPQINFEEGTSVAEAVEFLRQRAQELDNIDKDGKSKGVNINLRAARNTGATPAADTGLDAALGTNTLPTGGEDISTLRLPEIKLNNVPLNIALKYICDATRLRVKVDDYSVTLVPQNETDQDKFTRSFTVPPDFQSALNGAAGAEPAAEDPFGSASGPSTTGIVARPPIMELLKRAGVAFGDGASASLSGSNLLVFNTPNELDKVEQIVETYSRKQPKQVKITTKFVEISQENGEELGFDWVVGPFFSGDGSLAGSGGTIGSGGSRTGLDFSGPLIPGVTATDAVVSNIVTAGNRSGDFANNRNSIDAILNNPNRSTQNSSVAPGILSMTGLFSDGQLKVIMRGLSQKKGTDMMTAPSITARSGEKATIEIIREFIYPTEYDPPELPGNGGGRNNNGGGSVITAAIATPANPTSFATRNTGVTLEIQPTIGENDFMIDLSFVPEIVEFEGFINYGSPIQSAGQDAFGNSTQVTITENRIEMPVFATRRVNTALTIYDGYTVAIGGLMREDVQNVEDKVPILGDIPYIGRLFQTKSETRIKSNLIIFVTAQIIDPTGRPLRGADAADSLPALGSDASVLPEL